MVLDFSQEQVGVETYGGESEQVQIRKRDRTMRTTIPKIGTQLYLQVSAMTAMIQTLINVDWGLRYGVEIRDPGRTRRDSMICKVSKGP